MIYFIKSESGHVKIGYTENHMETRLKTIQANCPLKLELINCINGTQPFEKKIHKFFAKYRTFGEWFDLPPEINERLKSKIFIDSLRRGRFSKNPIVIKLELWREKHNISIWKAENILSVSSTTLSKIINGRRRCPPWLAKEIERVTSGLLKKEELVWP